MSDLLKAMQAKRQRMGKTGIDVDSTSANMPLDIIQDRLGGDTRPLNQGHVKDLAESIALLGLIEPIAVDSKGRLLAGGQRRAAISLLREIDPETYEKRFSEGVPVHRLSFDSELQPDLAIQVEVAENEHRRDYTPAEVRAIADKFREAGYGVRGRPGKGQSPLIPALMAVVGKSRATVKRYLAEDSGKNDSKSGSGEPDYDQLLRQGYKVLSLWRQKQNKSKDEKFLADELARGMQAIEVFLGEVD